METAPQDPFSDLPAIHSEASGVGRPRAIGWSTLHQLLRGEIGPKGHDPGPGSVPEPDRL